MGLSSIGIGSNLDVDSIVSKLMSVEQQPLILLQTKEASFQAKLSGFGTLKSAMAQFQTSVAALSNINQFQVASASVADPSVATVSATASATPGSHTLAVTQLAQAQKLVAAGTSSQLAPIGSGVISIDFGSIDGGSVTNGIYSGATFTSAGGGIKTITIDASNNSLSGIRDAINQAGIGVTASIVNDGSNSPYRLTLSSDATGQKNSMKISVADSGSDTALSTLLNNDPAASQALTQTAKAQSANLTIDGIAVTKASNSVTDVLSGVTLNLLAINSTTSPSTTLTVARDTTSATTAINAFVKAYNDISQTLIDSSAYTASTKTAAILNGESTVLTMQNQIRNLMTAPVAGGASAFSRLSDIGVSMQKTGLLAVDSTKLSTAMSSNFNDVAGLFAASGKASDSLVAYSGATSKTQPGSYAVVVSQLATMGSSQGSAAAGLTIDASNNTLNVGLNGLTATITLSQKTYASAADLAAEVQSKINGVAAFGAAGAAVQVSASSGVLKVTSTLYGSASVVSLTGSGAANLMFDNSVANAPAGVDVAGTINGVSASGSGQLLTGAASDASAGLAINVSGALGARGTVSYSQGYAYQLNALSTAMLDPSGALASRTDGIAASIKMLTQNQTDIATSMTATEARYRAQFTALDVLISGMSATTAFLTTQLAQISANTVAA